MFYWINILETLRMVNLRLRVSVISYACADIHEKHSQKNTRHSPNVGLMLGQRRRRWTNIEPTLGESHVFAGFAQNWLSIRRLATQTFVHPTDLLGDLPLPRCLYLQSLLLIQSAVQIKSTIYILFPQHTYPVQTTWIN